MELLERHPRHLLAGALALGLLAAPLDDLTSFAAAALVVVLLSAAGLRAHVAIGCAALLIIGTAAGDARLAKIDADPLARLPSSYVTLRGHLVDLPRVSEHGTRMRMRVSGAGQLVELRTRRQLRHDARIGDELIASGRLTPVELSGAGERAAGYLRQLLRNGVRRQLAARSVSFTGDARGGALGVVDGVRRRAEDALALGLAPEPAALLRGMVLGGDAALAEETAEEFRIAGLSHILAVSGQNVLLIVILLQAILSALGAGRRWRLLLPAVVIVIYVLLCGAQPSVIRAGAMGLAALAALAASRPASRSYALILATIVVLAWNPRAVSDVGAQLSFAAVLGIIAFTQPLVARLASWPGWAAQAFAATAGATLATAPLMAWHFKAVSLISLAANVLGEPLIGPIVWLGSLTAAAGQLSVDLAALLNAPNGFLLATLIELAHWSAAVPGARVETPDFGGAALLFAGLCVLLLALLANRPTYAARLPPPATALPVLVLAAAVIFLLRPSELLLERFGGGRLEAPAVAMVDVGQGDALLLAGRGCNVLIDGGPPGGELTRKLRRLGVRRLDLLLVTHADDDHYGGALELVRAGRLPVRRFLDGGGPDVSAAYAELRSRLAARGVPRSEALAGAAWSCPGVALRLLAPQPLAPGQASPGTNERAAVALIEAAGLRIFAAGDAESPQLVGLPLSTVDVLKVSHHGSADERLPELLSRLRPQVALIGVGAENRYGHPTAQTLDALAAARVRTFRTDRDGTLVLRRQGDGQLRVERER